MRTRIVIIVFYFCVSLIAFGQKPKWVNNTPKELNNTYKFIEILSSGSDLSSAQTNAKVNLAQSEQLRNAVTIALKTGVGILSGQEIKNNQRKEDINKKVNVQLEIDGEKYNLQAVIVDEHVAGMINGQISLRTLFMAALVDNPKFDRTYLTTSYGAAPVAMSLIPGVGQMYKGSTVKGVCMLGGVAALGIGALLCENTRSDYKNKMKEQPEFAQSYNTKANNYETARNILIGAAAAVYVYNLVDAAVAKGARRIIVKSATNSYLSLHPVATPYATGLSLTYNF